MITPKEYASLLSSINKKFNKIDNMRVHNILSNYYPKVKKITEITLKIDYTKNGEPLSNNINKIGVPENAVQKQIKFRLDKCDKMYILLWIDMFIKNKEG